MDVALRHPGDAKVTTTRGGHGAKAEYEIWISDGDLVRTYAAVHKLGTQRPVRNRPRGLHDPDLPGTSQVYEPVTALQMETLPETFIHPAGFCQNVLATGRCTVIGAEVVSGREAVLLQCDHPRTTEVAGDRPDFQISIAVDRETGVILRLIESMGGTDDATGRGGRLRARRAAPAERAPVRLPHRDDDALLTEGLPSPRSHAYSPPIVSGLERRGRARSGRLHADDARKEGQRPRTASVRCPRQCPLRAPSMRIPHVPAFRAAPHQGCSRPPDRTRKAVRSTGRQTATGPLTEGGTDDTGSVPAKTQIKQDVADLHRLGYAQELFRSMGGFSNFAISFSIISILTGAVILYDYGLAWAGTAAVMIGWPLITVFVLAIAASMAELASAYPTAGGLYYWASKMKNKNWGWWTAWLNLIGQFAIVAGIDYAAAGFINATILDRLTGGVFNTTEIIPGDPQRPARDDGRHPGDPARAQHRRYPPGCAPQPGERLVAHRDRRHRGRIHLPDRQTRSVRPEPLPDPAARHGRELEQQPRVHQPPIRARLELSGHRGLLLLAAARELDLHGVRRVGPRGRGDGRGPDGECLGRLPVGRGERGGRLHLPGRPDDPSAQPGDALPSGPRRHDAAGVEPVLLRWRRRRDRHPRVQPRATRRPPRGRDRDRHVVLRPVVGRRRRPDALCLQPR